MNQRKTTRHDSPTSLTEQAAHWWVVLNDGDPTTADQREFAEWIAKSPERVEAYLEITALRQALSKRSVRWPKTSVETLIREARASGGDVDSLVSSARAGETARVPSTRHWRIGISIAATILIVVAAFWIWISGSTHYSTDIGEQRAVPLADGSLVTLNTSTAIGVNLGQERRIVRLSKGEALFRVAHDAARPFEVIVGDTTVRAVGTEFNVDRRESRTTVTVIDGRVLVDAVPVAATEQVTVAARQVSTPERLADLAPVTAWTQRRLIFERRPLQEVAEEFNRYNREKIEIRDAALRAETVTGVFAADDADSFIAFLEQIPNVAVQEAPDGTWLVVVGGPS